jgi:hypothetical protein
VEIVQVVSKGNFMNVLEKCYIYGHWGNLRERDHLEDPGIDGRIIIIRWISRSGMWGHVHV